MPCMPQMFKEVARPPERLNKTRGIGVIAAPSDVVAKVVSDEYERWGRHPEGAAHPRRRDGPPTAARLWRSSGAATACVSPLWPSSVLLQ